MIPRLLDVAAFKTMARLSETEFSNYAALGMLPRAVGLYRGAAIWSEEHVGDFVRGTLKRDPDAFDDDELPVVTSAAVVAVPEVPAVVDDGKPAFHRAEFLNQLQAAEYMAVAPGWVSKRQNEGLLSATRQFGVMVYKREDLDALMSLPIYTLRKRKGFAHGKPLKENSAQKRQRIEREAHEARQVAAPSAVLSRKGAADFLGIHVEELAIMEKDKLGPAYSGLGYRVSDLEAFKAQHMKKDTRGEPWTGPQVMKYLGVSVNTLRTWTRTGKGPPCVSRAFEGRRQYVYDSNDVKAYKLEHAKDLEKIAKLSENAKGQHLGEIAAQARANRKRVAKRQAQAANTPRKAGAKVKATKPSPYNRGRGRVAGGASARA